MSHAGSRLVGGRYQLVEPIGRGGMGIVWRAHDELLDRAVAVKEVRYDSAMGDELDELNRRTMREARAAGRLTHPNVVVVHDVIEEDGRPWIIMQLVDSRSLGQVIREDGPLSPERTTEIGLQVLDALRAAHAQGVLHRDVKPENVLITDDGRVVLTDFGIARLEADSTMTRTGLVGTPAFIAPERLRGYPAQRESDLWSLGATLYTAVEGKPPHDRGMPLATMHAVLNDEPKPPVRAGRLGVVLDQLLRKEPADRPSYDETVRLLRRVAAAAAPPSPPTTVPFESPGARSAAEPPAPGSAAPRRVPMAPMPQTGARGLPIKQEPARPKARAVPAHDDSADTDPRLVFVEMDPPQDAAKDVPSGPEAPRPAEPAAPVEPPARPPAKQPAKAAPEKPAKAAPEKPAKAAPQKPVKASSKEPAKKPSGSAKPAAAEPDAAEEGSAGAKTRVVSTDPADGVKQAPAAKTGASPAAASAARSSRPTPATEREASPAAAPAAPSARPGPAAKTEASSDAAPATPGSRPAPAAKAETSRDAAPATRRAPVIPVKREEPQAETRAVPAGKDAPDGGKPAERATPRASAPVIPTQPREVWRGAETALVERRPRPVIRMALLIVAALVVVAIVAGYLGLRDGEQSSSGSTGKPATTGEASPSSSKDSTDKPTKEPSKKPSPSEPATPTPSPATSKPSDVPKGWKKFKDSSGFSVALPKGWKVNRRSGTAVWFRGPGTSGFLLIDQTSHPRDDAEKDWKNQEKSRKYTFSNYKRVRIESIDFWDEAADWEFTFGSGSGKTHVINRGFVTDKHHGYAIYWSTPEKTWKKDRHFFETFTATFKPDK